MKKLLNFIEHRLHFWKYLVVYMALTIWDAPEWCFDAFWIVAVAHVSTFALIAILGIMLFVSEEIRNIKSKDNGNERKGHGQ